MMTLSSVTVLSAVVSPAATSVSGIAGAAGVVAVCAHTMLPNVREIAAATGRLMLGNEWVVMRLTNRFCVSLREFA